MKLYKTINMKKEYVDYILDNYDNEYKNYFDMFGLNIKSDKTDEETLEDMDFKVVEAFVRKKKLERISNKNNKN